MIYVVNTFKGIVVGLVMLIFVVILCTTVLPDYLPTSGELDFLPTVIMIATGFGVALFAIAGLFKGGGGV